MKKILLAGLSVLLYSTNSIAQLSYTFTAVSGTYTANATPTTIHSTSVDDQISAAINIGFTFNYACSNYTQVRVSSNGWLTFNTAYTGSDAYNDLNTGSNKPAIAPLWDDLATSSSSSSVNYKLTGSAPNRIFTIEWSQMRWYYSSSNNVISFQCKLYETTNVIEFIYTQGGSAVSSGSASIGLSGNTSGDFYSLNGTGASPTASTVTETTTLNTKPANGQIYRWTPGGNCSGTPTGGTANASPTTISSCASPTTTLTLTGGSTGCGLTYQWQSAPAAAGPWTNISGATNTSYTANPASNTYYRVVTTCTNSGLSANSSSVLVTVTITIPPNDDPCNATALTVSSSCSYTTYTNACATATTAGSPPAPGCAFYSGGDVWFTAIVPASGMLTIDTQTGVITDAGMAVYSGVCGNLTLIECDDDDSPNGAMSMIALTGRTIGEIIYIRVWEYGGDNNGTFGICAYDPCPTLASNDNCSGAIALTMNPYGSCASTSAGNLFCSTPSGTAMGSCFGNPDDDIWYSFVATSTSHTITLTTASGFDAYMMLYSGTCGALNPLVCSDPDVFNASGLTPGQTYYIRVYSYATGAPTNGNITMCVSAPAACPANLGAGNVSIASLPYNGTGQTTCGAGNDITSSNASTCGSSGYFSDADKVYTFTPTSSGQITVTLNSTQTWTGMMLYDGCPFTANCVAYVQTFSSGSKSFCVSVVAGTTYYLVVDGWGTSGSCITSFTLDITAPSAGITNDLPCSATALTLGTSVTGNNTCTSGTGEPGTPSCWTSGSLNTVWYSFVAPASGNVYIQTTTTSINSTQIALYSGSCSALTYMDCNQYPPTGCSGTSSNYSVINVTGLTPGNTYYVRVDGRYDYTGTFSIIVDNGSSGTSSPIPGQDCQTPLVVCNSVMTIGNPGYANTGNICDFTGSGNCTSGELNSVWYQINIAATGNFNFTIMPNDGSNGSCGSETDYDYLLWKVSGSGTTTNCNTISSASGTALLACNFSYLGVTGVAPSGNAPAPISNCFDAAFEPTVAVTAGDVLYLVIQNYSGSTQGFVLDMTSSGAGVVNYSAPSTVYWTGGASTVWTNPTNWGSCSTVPSCAVNAVVTAASATQPIITGTESVKDLTINPGATLTLNAGAVLNVCGNFVNNGNLVASPTSTIIFNNAAVAQSISGSLTGTNKFGHLTITKTGGSVTLNNNLDIGGNFTTSNGTSVFNSNNYDIKVAGNFVNNNGNTTFTNTGTLGTLTFNGTAAQTYNQGSSQLDLNNVVMSHTSTGVTLLTNMNIKSTTGTLTLTQGKIITGAFEVNVANTTPACVSTGNTTSFVQGNLRRALQATGSYDFPVGHATPGYQRANVNFTAATSIGNLLARFDTWPSTPPTQGGTECGTTYNQPAENNGYWTLTANANPLTGTYNMTLYPTNATNTAGMGGWTVMKDPTIASGTWSLNGICDPTSTAAIVKRNSMNGFSVFGAAQAITPLPIELLSFTGHSEGKRNVLEWTTATEINNDYFTLEKSDNGVYFEALNEVDGAGNSSILINYLSYDHTPINGTTYYRLKQTDFNGQFKYSSIIGVENKLNTVAVDNFRPNPTSDNINFNFYTPIKGEVQIEIYDYVGKLVKKQTIEVAEGNTLLLAQMDDLSKGVYSIKVIFDQTSYSSVTKIIKN